jgi:carbonic anhydrase
MSQFLKVICVLLGIAISTAYGAGDSTTNWSYSGATGPDHWGELAPEFALCSTGKSQSPIDITSTVPEKQSLALHYYPSTMIIMLDGPTHLEILGKQTITNTGHSVQLNFPAKNPQEMLNYAGKHYHLIQFHFHTPSETKLNGKTYPMEIHFVHQGDDGAVAVLAVLVDKGATNPTLQSILDNVPKTEKIPQDIKGKRINPVNLVPDDKTFYHFVGSLTTPPCSEGLEWVVLKNTIAASPQQIEKFNATSHGDNVRPVQSLNDRKVFYEGQ